MNSSMRFNMGKSIELLTMRFISMDSYQCAITIQQVHTLEKYKGGTRV